MCSRLRALRVTDNPLNLGNSEGSYSSYEGVTAWVDYINDKSLNKNIPCSPN